MLDDRLVKLAEPLLGESASVNAGFIATEGPRPGSEIVPFLLFSACFIVGLPMAVAATVGIAGLVAIFLRRRTRAIVLTKNQVIVLACSRRGRLSAAEVIAELDPAEALTIPDPDQGDKRIEVDETRYWVSEANWDEARRMAKLIDA